MSKCDAFNMLAMDIALRNGLTMDHAIEIVNTLIELKVVTYHTLHEVYQDGEEDDFILVDKS